MKYRNERLARNLANAYAAAILGTTVATQERNNRVKQIGEFWYFFADEIEQQMLALQNVEYEGRMKHNAPMSTRAN